MKNTISLNKNKLFRRVYYRGKTVVSPVLVTYILKNNLRQNRIGITTSKKIGKAAIRNRAKRVIKAAYNRLESSLPIGFDFVFVARGKTANYKSTYIEYIMQKNVRNLLKI